MTHAEDATLARSSTRKHVARLMVERHAAGETSVQVLGAAVDLVSFLTMTHLSSSKGDDIALIWAREAASLGRELQASHVRALIRRQAAARAVK